MQVPLFVFIGSLKLQLQQADLVFERLAFRGYRCRHDMCHGVVDLVVAVIVDGGDGLLAASSVEQVELGCGAGQFDGLLEAALFILKFLNFELERANGFTDRLIRRSRLIGGQVV